VAAMATSRSSWSCGHRYHAMFSMHFASVLTKPRWPQVDCHRIFTHPDDPAGDQGGERQPAPVPDAPRPRRGTRRRCRRAVPHRAHSQTVPGARVAARSPMAHGGDQLLRARRAVLEDVRSRRFPCSYATSTWSQIAITVRRNGRIFKPAAQKADSWFPGGRCNTNRYASLYGARYS